jgi:Na+/melibiose symporter-like transporter
MFITDLVIMIIFLLIWGLAFGGFWTILWPVLADVIDESVAATGKRSEGIYTGIQAFFGRLAFLFQALIFTIVHIATNFQEGQPLSAQPAEAVVGIQLHFSLIPMAFMAVAMIVFWKFFDLTPDKVQVNRDKIKELGI